MYYYTDVVGLSVGLRRHPLLARANLGCDKTIPSWAGLSTPRSRWGNLGCGILIGTFNQFAGAFPAVRFSYLLRNRAGCICLRNLASCGHDVYHIMDIPFWSLVPTHYA